MIDAKILLNKAKQLNRLMDYNKLYTSRTLLKLCREKIDTYNYETIIQILVIARQYGEIYYDSVDKRKFLYWKKWGI